MKNNNERMIFAELLAGLDKAYSVYTGKFTNFSKNKIILAAKHNGHMYTFTKMAFCSQDDNKPFPEIRLISDLHALVNNKVNLVDDYADIVTLECLDKLCDDIINSEENIFKSDANLSYDMKVNILKSVPIALELIDLSGNTYNIEVFDEMFALGVIPHTHIENIPGADGDAVFYLTAVENLLNTIGNANMKTVKVKATWEFEVDISDFDPKSVKIEELAVNLVKLELDYLLKRNALSSKDFEYTIDMEMDR